MEYIIGSVIALICVYIGKKVIANTEPINSVSFRYSQSHIFELTKSALPFLEYLEKENVQRQSAKYHKSVHVKVLMVDNQAYWIKDNVFYTADILDGIVDTETTKVVDTMAMDSVELDKITFIVDKLNEGNSNDYRGSGNS